MKVDAHQHFWNPTRGDYSWMPDDHPILSRPYFPDDISAARFAAGVDKTVLVQAAPTTDETEYLLGLGDATDFVGGVVGWVNFEDPKQRTTLDRLSRHPLFKGVRPMIQDIADDNWMLRDDVQWGYQALVDLDLTFDALGFPRHLANFLTICTRYPEMRVVIDHCMKPDIANHTTAGFQFWANGMSLLASETPAYCKFSGLVTEADENWTLEQLQPYADHVFDVFGPERVMWGSDWPVCRLKAEYDRWHDVANTLSARLNTDEKKKVFGETAATFYRIIE